MRTIIQTKNTRIPGFLQRWFDRSLAKISEHHRNLILLTARISKEKNNLFRVQLTVKAKGKDHVIEVEQHQLFWALSDAVDRLQRQLRKNKERTHALIKRRKRQLRAGIGLLPESATE